MLIATWNVNSVRTRLSQITNWIKNVNPDILCLQETKVIDDSFPITPFKKLGYEVIKYGQKSYNGVAIISRLKIENVKKGFTHYRKDKNNFLSCINNYSNESFKILKNITPVLQLLQQTLIGINIILF